MRRVGEIKGRPTPPPPRPKNSPLSMMTHRTIRRRRVPIAVQCNNACSSSPPPPNSSSTFLLSSQQTCKTQFAIHAKIFVAIKSLRIKTIGRKRPSQIGPMGIREPFSVQALEGRLENHLDKSQESVQEISRWLIRNHEHGDAVVKSWTLGSLYYCNQFNALEIISSRSSGLFLSKFRLKICPILIRILGIVLLTK